MAFTWAVLVLGLPLVLLDATPGCKGKDHQELEIHQDTNIESTLSAIKHAVDYLGRSIQETIKLQKKTNDAVQDSIVIHVQNSVRLAAVMNILCHDGQPSESVFLLKEKLAEKDKMVQDLQQKLAESLSLIEEMRENQKLLNKTVELQNKRVAEAGVLVQQLNIKKQLQEYNSTKDWTSLRRGLETVVDKDSVAYKQLQKIKNGEEWALWYVGKNGFLELATLLVVGGQELEAKDLDRGTILQGAASGGHLEMVKMLLDHRADINAVSGAYNRAAIAFAADDNRLDVVKLLMERGADISILNSYGQTILHSAARYGYLEMVQFLVSAGVSTTATDNQGLTPLDLATRNGHTATEQYLSQYPH